ncbi:hypothetical protein L544_0017 [Bordetella hinzii OH87 BAL007II]|uniref:N-acetyltransferase YedL n=1 Tax=Bordetella hinzii OH87 BAL007II TaxID=1331262 RepID=A0ABR4QV72_9BORD|nr:hypothetical protein L544_0017 [Bordetella hinzii OH87 BAL007II]KCB32601.1 hypothetical protein L543_0006 [Bordetella hinzii L60]
MSVQLNRAFARPWSSIQNDPLRAAHYSSIHWRSCTLSGLRDIPQPGYCVEGLGLLRALGTVLRAGLLTVLDALQVEGAAHDVITHTGQVLHTTATHQDDRVLLQVVAFAADVRNDFVTVGQTHLGNLTQSGVRLLGGGGVDTGANATALGAILQRGALALDDADFARLAHELANGRHDL